MELGIGFALKSSGERISHLLWVDNLYLLAGNLDEFSFMRADSRISDEERLCPGAIIPAKVMLGLPVAEIERILSKTPVSPLTIAGSPTAAITSSFPLMY